MNRARIGFLAAALLLLLVLSLGLGLEGAWRRVDPATGPDTLIVVPAGSSARAIARQLGEAGVLARPRLFLWGLRFSGDGAALRAGRYLFRRPSSPAELLRTLRKGETELLWLTLPEGLWLREAVGQISRQLGLDSLDLVRRAQRPQDWTHPFLEGATDLEGYLLPDTYAFEYPPDPELVLGTLLDAFDAALSKLQRQAPEDWHLPPRAWTTLASIVEAEALRDEERGSIARVYLNRLERGMKLEADPTVLYALGWRKPRVYYKDLDLDSPYNTYRHDGLPPGPICSPGRASLAALLERDPGDRNLYFVADGQGGHRFSESFSEHLRNVAALRGKQGKP